ncbi:VOC family protein [Streptomyces pristinaespiralis]|uniref:VOC family protein n=1 Tax=Streptomyces pristinaespiralis TaxID=38300 RepID=UPI00340FBB67
MLLVTAEVIGSPCWLSLTARDKGASERFYEAVLGWSYGTSSFGRAFSVAEVGGVPVAGIGAVAGEFAVPTAWTVYFAVDDADAAVARVRERGGTVAVGPIPYPPDGRAAFLTDQEGAAFGIWDGTVVAEWSAGGRSPLWLELHTRNAFDAAIFYGEVLEWGTGAPDACCEVSYEDDRVVLRSRGTPVARLNSGPVEEAAPKPQLRPRWLVHFKVPDLDAAVSAALQKGGTKVTDLPWNSAGQVTVRDPDGALFTLDQSVEDA